MDEKALRKTIGSRTKARRKELKLSQSYLAEKLDVNKSTIQRYESGAIDNTKRLVVEGIASALHVTPEYLRGETDIMESEITDKRSLEILDAIEKIKEVIPLGIPSRDNEFAENMLLLILKEYLLFTDSFSKACHWYSENESPDLVFAEAMGFESREEMEQIKFLGEIMHTINTFHDLSEILRVYARDPDKASMRIRNLLDYM